MGYAVFWIAAIIIFVVLEACTSALISIWFAGGALAALIFKICGAGLALQIVVFLLVSLVCVFLLRSISIKALHSKQNQTNLDRIIGKKVIISETVDNKNNQGKVIIGDIEWRVKSENEETIPAGKTAEVVGGEGVKLIVKED